MKFKPGTILTLISLSITLFLIGFYLLVLVHLTKVEDIIHENTPFVIELQDSLSSSNMELLVDQLKNRPYVLTKSVEFLSKEEGLVVLEKEFGQQLLVDSTSNPLRDVILLNLSSTFIKEKKTDSLIEELKSTEGIQSAYFEEGEVNNARGNLKKINMILLITGLLFIVVSIILIYNNLKLVLRSDRFQLKTMELVGASPSFIKMPYIKKSIMIGLLAAGINIIIYALILSYLSWKLDSFSAILDISMSILVMIFLVFLGIILPLVFSNILISKFVRMPEELRYK